MIALRTLKAFLDSKPEYADARDATLAWYRQALQANRGRRMTTRREAILATAASAILAGKALAQPAPARRIIGFHLWGDAASQGHLVEEFKSAMKALGHEDGRDVVYEIRWANNKLERLPELAAELVALKPAAIIAQGSPSVAACQRTTATIPIVFTSAGDPIRQGFIQSYPRPGGNITGVAFNEEINKKIYEVLKELMPQVSRVATLVNLQNQAQRHHLDDLPLMAKRLNFQSILVEATRQEELESAFQKASTSKAQAMVVSAVAPFSGLIPRIVELQHLYRLPTFYGVEAGPENGGVASYSFPLEENYRRSATIVDKILKGQKPADIPVEIPTRYEVTINLKAAKALGIPLPQPFLARVHKRIE